MKEDNKNKINRRDFFKLAGAGTLASAAALYGCSGNKNNGESESAALGEIPTDKMTYRTNPNTGDRVSLLGYGCMRWPTRKRADGNGDEIDQEAVNDLIDYAIAHGVNYFDTSPAYVQGLSERATGIALKRHPREKIFLATKLSNFSPSTHSREESLAMYHRSFRDLQVDYIDYLLLHGIGMGGMEALRSRYLDNGMLDFLLKEREAGRIRNLGFSYHGDIEVFDYLLSRHDELKWDFVQIQLNYVDWRHAKEVNTRNTDAEYLYAELVKRNIPAVIMEPLLGGRLSRLNDHLMARLKQRRPQESVASWAFRFAGTFPDVLTVLSGMTYMEHLQDNLRTFSPLVPCTEEEFTLLEDTAQRMLQYPTVPCNDCKYCMPCPYGLDIPAILLHYNRCINEGNVPQNSQDENYREARRAFLAVFDILRQCFSKRRIRFQVKCRKTVVENKDFRVFCNRTRNRQTLFLSAGYVRSALCNRGFVFVIFCLDKLGCLRNCGCLFDLRIRRIVFSEAQVGCDRSREQHTFLRHETDLIAQILHRNVSNIFSVERNLSARHIIETWDQVDQRRFTAAGASDDRRRLARLGNEVDVMQHILLGARITEVDVIEADNSVVNLQLLRILTS